MNFDDTARFFGPSDKLWPDLFSPPDKRATKLCLDCRKREVRPRQKYCPVCSKIRNREQKREHMRRKRGSDVEKVANSPIGAEALTRLENEDRYDDPQAAKTTSNFSTQKEAA